VRDRVTVGGDEQAARVLADAERRVLDLVVVDVPALRVFRVFQGFQGVFRVFKVSGFQGLVGGLDGRVRAGLSRAGG